MGRDALMLLAHGSRDPRTGHAVATLAQSLARHLPSTPVVAAFLEHGSPGPLEAARRLPEAVARNVVVPLFLTEARHVARDVPVTTDRLQATFPHRSTVVAEPVGSHPAIEALSWRRLQGTVAGCEEPGGWRYLFIGRGGGDPARRYRELAGFLERRGVPPWIAETRLALLTDPDWERELVRGADMPLVVQPHLLFCGRLSDRIARAVDRARAQREAPVRCVACLGPSAELQSAVLDRYASLDRPAHTGQVAERCTSN